MKTIRFYPHQRVASIQSLSGSTTNTVLSYVCDTPGDQSGEYVPKAEADRLQESLDTAIELLKVYKEKYGPLINQGDFFKIM